MRKITILLVLIIFYSNTWAQKIDPQVKKEVELMSILARLAGYGEYNDDRGGRYTADIDSILRKYRSHEAVKMMKQFKKKYGLGYDRVMSIALQIECRGDSIVSVMAHFDQEWYTRFYGTPPAEQFRIIIGFTNGPCNYGPSRKLTGQPKEVFAIMNYAVDDNERPIFYKKVVETVVHEFCHSFTKIKGDTEKALEKSGKALQEYTYFSMRRQAYSTWRNILEESLVRAATICYLIDHNYDEKDIRNAIIEQVDRNFFWMPELVQTLRYYESHRKKYPTFTSFYPEIIRFFDRYVADVEKEIQKALK